MSKDKKQRVPWFVWPFWAILRLVGFIIEMVGRLVGAILGFVIFVIGILLCLTLIGAIVGVPLAAFGLLLFFRSLLG